MRIEMVASLLLPFCTIAGIVFLVIAGAQFSEWLKLLKAMQPILATNTSTAAELKDVIQAIQKNLGNADIFREKVELEGVIHSDEPIIAELSQKPCVYVRTLYEDKFEETYKDEQNRVKAHYVSEVLADNIRTQLFQIEDRTGRISVDPKGAKFELTQVVNRFEPDEISEKVGNRRKVGRQYNEWILSVGIQVYVFGEISCSGNDFIVQKPLKQRTPFIISRDSEENFERKKRQKMRETKNKGLTSLALCIFLISIAHRISLSLANSGN